MQRHCFPAPRPKGFALVRRARYFYIAIQVKLPDGFSASCSLATSCNCCSRSCSGNSRVSTVVLFLLQIPLNCIAASFWPSRLRDL